MTGATKSRIPLSRGRIAPHFGTQPYWIFWFSKWIVRRNALPPIILVCVNGARCAPYQTRIGFSVATLLDGVASIKFEGRELNPILTFQIDEDKMLYAGGNSWMHEYVYRLLPKLFLNNQDS
jgi:hypothetical protein